MKHTDFYQMLNAIGRHERSELIDAVIAHGGCIEIAQKNENGRYVEEGCPIVLASSRYDECAKDYTIVKLTVETSDCGEWLTIYGIEKEYGLDPEIVDPEPGHIGYIIDAIPDTQYISDVTRKFQFDGIVN